MILSGGWRVPSSTAERHVQYDSDNIVASMHGHDDAIWALSPSLNGELLLSASADGLVKYVRGICWCVRCGIVHGVARMSLSVVVGTVSRCPDRK